MPSPFNVPTRRWYIEQGGWSREFLGQIYLEIFVGTGVSPRSVGSGAWNDVAGSKDTHSHTRTRNRLIQPDASVAERETIL